MFNNKTFLITGGTVSFDKKYMPAILAVYFASPVFQRRLMKATRKAVRK